ncbi:Fatty acid synthase subunit beta [Phytophthora cinnamomi]|uniref:Fatty acid synthase subunit beta n=1 Tax=Phytophthora cinnamomi TaxID=4785 RepID=UPI003559B002|nr:Fatty acid synthase subunit beta [Phytophthora cinnamomi]
MEETYAAIRRVSNVLLVVGSGFGNWEDSKQYLTGEWSLSRGHLHKMPADGILMGSRVMVAKEAATAPAVKKLLVDTPGIESELEWETSYTGVVGGVVTVTSELGEPIHVVANRCALLWKEFDDKYFSIPREQVELALRLNKKDIITRLNADYQKPYFGCKRNVETGEVVPAELEEMSYGDVLTRLVDLTYVEVEGKPQRWVHDTYFSRVSKFITRTEERFRRESSGALFDQSELKSNPRGTVSAFIAKYPATVSTLLSVPDCDFFLELCRTGGKPVNFVPAIDAEFKTWFKKDSLWYSEDLDAVPEHDAQRVFILQGPVAVRYSTVVDEPVADILEGINTGFVNVVKESGAIAAAPVVAAKQTVDIAGVEVTETDGSVEVSIPTEESAVPSADEWLAALAASVSDKEWLQALISSTHVVEEKKWLANPVRQLLVPQAGQKYVVDAAGVRVFDSSIDISGPVIEITKKDASIAVVVNEVRPAVTELKAGVVALEMTFQHHPELSCAVHSEGSGFIDKVKAFYARFWVAIEGKEEESCEAACAESVMSPFTADFSITKEDIVAYRAALGLNEDEEGAPADFSTIVSWRPLIQSVFTKEVKGNLLDLVHLKHSYKLLSSRKASATFLPGDDIVSTSNVGSLRIIDSGKIVHGVAIISRKTVDEQMEEVLEPLVELHSEFLIRGSFEDFESTFSIDKSTDEFVPSRPEDVEILKAKSWLKLGAETSVNVGDHLSFELTTKKQYASIGSLSSVEVSGVLFRADAGSNVEIGTVEFTSQEVNESPVVAFLRQVQPADTNAGGMFANGGSHMLEKPLEIDVPTNALAYAVASRDLNPIHRSKYAAILGHLPKGKPIMHGLWTATKVRDLVISSFGLGFDSNVVDYDVNFDGMVYPGDKLFMQARHIGLDNGKKVLSVEAMLRGMLDLRQVVVVTGFGEVSPWGNSRTRWEMESYGEFSLEGCIELAWLTGRIVFDKGNWVDAKTKEIVPDHQVKPRYEEDILKHSGIRIVEPELFDGYDPKNKMVLHQVAIDKKMSPIEVADREEALQFRKELGKENVDVFQNASGAWMIRLRKGSVLNIPRALNFDRFVAGQIPTGWSAERLGLSKDLADAVDPITLYVLASTMDAFVAAGVMDPYEFYHFHGTGTKANDKNESEVTHKQMAHLGRSAGNPLPVICQKNLTGHPKGAAAAWMLNGLLQVLNTGLIPGNRQLDNTCETLRKYDHLVYPNRSYQTVGVKAVMMKSFGFGQAGGEVVLVHPDYLLSTLAGEEFRHYSARREQRLIKMNTHVQGVITGKQAHIQVKNEAPYSSAQESNVYLDPTARAEYDATSKTWRFGGADSLTAEENRRQRAEKRAKKAKAAAEAAALSKKTTETHSADSSSTLLTAINQAATDLGLASKNMGMGVDVEPVATFENLNGREDFIRRNFTDQEMAYCYSAPHPAASFAGRWAAKEAVIKAISSSSPTEPNLWKGAGAPLREIEIFMTASGAPSVLLSGYPLQVFNRLGLSKLSVSISHSGDFAVSQAVANFQE